MWEQFLTTVAASAIGTAIAGALGIRYGLKRLRSERAFERRLQWYETAIGDLTSAAEKLETVIASARSDESGSASAELFQEALPVLRRADRLKTEAQMYASVPAYEAVVEAANDISALVRAAAGVPQNVTPHWPDAQPRLLEIGTKLIRHAIRRLADDAREHLELEALPPHAEPGVYDREYLDHIADLKARGMWPPERAAVEPTSKGS